MGTIRKYRSSLDAAGQHNHLVIVPGISNESLAKQTCDHFERWIDKCSSVSKTVWIFDHGVNFTGERPLDSFCSAGPVLLRELLGLSQIEDCCLTLVGHRLGAFVLKQSLILAHKNGHHKEQNALFEAIQTLIMIGEPELHDDNRADWCSLVAECLRNTEKILNVCNDYAAFNCLKNISDKFEAITIHSHYFQVSGQGTPRSRMVLKLRHQHKQCVCNANVSARVWSTAEEDTLVPGAAGNEAECVFHPRSTHNKALLSIANNAFITAASLGPSTINMAPEIALTASTIEEDQDSGADSTIQADDNQALEDVSEHEACIETFFNARESIASGDPDWSTDCGKDQDDGNTITSMSAASEQQDQNQGSQAISTGLTFEPSQQFERENKLRRPRQLPVMKDVPATPSPFVGRSEILKELERCLVDGLRAPSRIDEVGAQRVVCLHGMGGIGKTAVVSKGIRQVANNFDHVIWLRAHSPPSLRHSVQEAAIVLDLIPPRSATTHTESKVKLNTWLETTSSKWLLIFDGCDQLDLIEEYLPVLPRGHVIVTSRRDDFSQLERPNRTVDVITIQSLTECEAFELLRGLSAPKDDIEIERQDLLVHTAKGHPLALKLLLPLLEESEISFHKVEDLPAVLMPTSTLTSTSGNERLQAKVASLVASVAKLEHIPRPAADLCYALSFLDHDEIDDCVPLEGRNIPDIRLFDFPVEDEAFETAKSASIRFRIVEQRTERTMSACRFLMDFIRYSMGPERQKASLDTAIRLVSAQWPSKRRLKHCIRGSWPEFDKIYQNAWSLGLHFLELAPNLGSSEGEANTALLKRLAKLLLQTTWYNTHIRGNAQEDASLVVLAHRLHEISQIRSSKCLATNKVFSHQLPKRLLRIDRRSNTWRLVECGERHLPYTALSFSWAIRSTVPKCTRQTIHEYSIGQPLDKLPGLYNEAADVSTRCGIHHLWVDSLCIIQDDDEDVNRELPKMADTYANASFVIIPNVTASETNFLPSVRWNCTRDEDFDQTCVKRGNWDRAWTFQERYLSESILELDKTFWSYDCASHGPANGFSLKWEIQRPDELFEEVLCISGDSDETNCIEEASLAAAEGIKHYEDGSLHRAAARFVQARDQLYRCHTGLEQVQEKRQMYTLYLAMAWLEQGLAAESLELLDRALQEPCDDLETPVEDEFSIMLGQMHIAAGDAHLMLAETEKASQAYSTALDLISPSEDLFAVLQLKRAQICVANSDYTEAHALIALAIDHFEKHDGIQGQAQLARALYRQSLVFGEEHNEKRRKRSMKRAVDAVTDYYEELGENVELQDPATEQDFRRPLRFGYR